ncbi:MAG: ATP-dependent helicase, partial [Lachnospiraceae bacterium]|nr:ATP-dependent helicase [Lachnospiraceae bacterium]
MSLQLIAGRSGSGKTTWLYEYMIRESMEHPDQKYMILVPEQFTMETQRMITQMHPRHGTMNINVLSFARLAYQIFAELNKEDFVVIDEMGKSVLLQKAVLRCADKLPVFGRNLKRPGFISQLKSQLSELIQYGVSNVTLDQAAKKMANNHMLAGKLKDMSLVYESFQNELDYNSFTSDQLLIVLADLIWESKIVEDCIIGLDGYTGFTPVQYLVIRNLLEFAEKLMVTVTVDPGSPFHGEAPSHDLFHLGRHTVVKLLELAQRCDIEVEEDVILGGSPRYVPG